MATDPTGFVERYSSWTGRAWLEVDGPGLRVPFREGYGEERRRWRAAWPDRPWDTDWADGTFEPAPFGLPLLPVLAVASVTGAALVLAAGGVWGAGGALLSGAALLWPVLRLLDHASITGAGVRAGPPWAMRIAWGDVARVGLCVTGRRAELWVEGVHGAARVDVPRVLVPAIRARVRRFGGLIAEVGDGGLDLRYARWRAAAAGIPAGVLAGCLAAAPFATEPFRILFVGGLVTTGLGALGAAVEARGTGWGAGGVLWSTVAFGVILVALALGT